MGRVLMVTAEICSCAVISLPFGLLHTFWLIWQSCLLVPRRFNFEQGSKVE